VKQLKKTELLAELSSRYKQQGLRRGGSWRSEQLKRGRAAGRAVIAVQARAGPVWLAQWDNKAAGAVGTAADVSNRCLA
jgi:hypothetical protein